MARVVVTGANRGIGLGFARAFVDRGDTVIAGVRAPDVASELASVLGDKGHVFQLDVSDETSVVAFGSVVAGLGAKVDLLINNAGTLSSDPSEAGPLGGLTADALENVLRVNVVGPVLVTQALAPTLAADARVVNISSGMGSITSANSMYGFGYSVSKTALNMATRQMAFDPSLDGRTVVVVSPGWVQTGMGGPEAAITVEQSISDMLKIVDSLTPEATGQFFDHAGGQIPW